MPVVLGNTTGTAGATTTATVVHTTSAGSDHVIFAMIGMDNRNDVGVVPTVTCSPALTVVRIAALDNIDTASGSEKNSLFYYYMVGAAASTTYTISMTQSGARGTELIAVDFSGVDQTTPYDGGTTTNDISTAAVSITPTVATPTGGYSLAIAGGYKGSNVAAGTGTLLYQGGNGSHASGVSSIAGNGTAQAHNFTVTSGGAIHGATVLNIIEGVTGTVVSISGVASTTSIGSVAPQLASITHVFKDSSGASFWGDGVNVTAFKSSTLASVPLVIGSGAIAGGAGSVTIGLTENTAITLIPDHLHVGAPTNEQGITSSLTPV